MRAVANTSPKAESKFQILHAKMLRRFDLWVLAGALVCYFLLAFGLARTKAPWVDEGWIASAPANWAHTGSFGTPSLEADGSWLYSELTGIKQYTYWTLPVAIALQAIWFKILGFDVFTMRLLGILFGGLALISWSAIVTRLSGIRLAGPLSAAFLAVDFTFLWGAADGRMDIICLAFGAAGIAAYLLLRNSRWTLSLWLANTCIALSMFTHPNGLMPFLSLTFLLVYYDRRRLGWRDLATITPFFIIAAAWGLYILQRPAYFLAQFAANASAGDGGRVGGFVHPLLAVIGAILMGLNHYRLDPILTGSIPKYAVLIPFIYGLMVAIGCVSRSMRRKPDRFALLCLTAIQLCFMTFFMGLKLDEYIIFILPFCAGLVAIEVCLAFMNRRSQLWSVAWLAAALVACQLGTVLFLLKKDSYHREYLPTVQFMRERMGHSDPSVIANSYFGFDLGFKQIRDDERLGFYSGLRPEFIIEDEFYREIWDREFSIGEPATALYVSDLLATEYHLVFANGQYRVYERGKS